MPSPLCAAPRGEGLSAADLTGAGLIGVDLLPCARSRRATLHRATLRRAESRLARPCGTKPHHENSRALPRAHLRAGGKKQAREPIFHRALWHVGFADRGSHGRFPYRAEHHAGRFARRCHRGAREKRSRRGARVWLRCCFRRSAAWLIRAGWPRLAHPLSLAGRSARPGLRARRLACDFARAANPRAMCPFLSRISRYQNQPASRPRRLESRRRFARFWNFQ